MGGLLLGIDIGTSSVKAVVCATDGRLVCQASADNALLTPAPGLGRTRPGRVVGQHRHDDPRLSGAS